MTSFSHQSFPVATLEPLVALPVLIWQEEFLASKTQDKNLARLLMSMGEALRTIAFKVRTASCGATACINTFGDEQLAVDMLADKLLFEVSSFSGLWL